MLEKIKNLIPINGPQLNGVIRHVLNTVGAILIALGLLDEELSSKLIETAMVIIGGLITMIAYVNSYTAVEKLN